MAPPFSKVDSNKFWHDVQNEVTLICAKFGKDLVSISKVVDRTTKWPWFFLPTLYVDSLCIISVKLNFGKSPVVTNLLPMTYDDVTGWTVSRIRADIC